MVRYKKEEDFLEKLVEYLEEEIVRVKALDRELWDPRKAAEFDRAYISSKEAGSTVAKVKAYANMLKMDVDNWLKFSMSSDTEVDKIIMRLILDYYYLKEPSATICISYLSSNRNITENDVKEIIYISSGFFRFDEWDSEHVNAVVNSAIANTWDESMDILNKVYTADRINSVFGKLDKEPRVPIIFPIRASAGAVRYSNQFRKEFAAYFKTPGTYTMDYSSADSEEDDEVEEIEE